MVNNTYRSFRTKIPNRNFWEFVVNGKQPSPPYLSFKQTLLELSLSLKASALISLCETTRSPEDWQRAALIMETFANPYLLGEKPVHVSVFVPVEFPDLDLNSPDRHNLNNRELDVRVELHRTISQDKMAGLVKMSQELSQENPELFTS